VDPALAFYKRLGKISGSLPQKEKSLYLKMNMNRAKETQNSCRQGDSDYIYGYGACPFGFDSATLKNVSLFVNNDWTHLPVNIYHNHIYTFVYSNIKKLW
jgi:hypothetical protein